MPFWVPKYVAQTAAKNNTMQSSDDKDERYTDVPIVTRNVMIIK